MASNSNEIVDANLICRVGDVLRGIARRRDQNFSGVGLVFYDRLLHLPHLQLSNSYVHADPDKLSEDDLAIALSCISVTSNPLHDGFHFINARRWQITHLSQFISPPIPPDAAHRFHGTGARLMAALLTSILPGIECVGLVSQGGSIQLFRHGNNIYKKD